MAHQIRKKLKRITILYWTLLLYMIAALLWWYISLENQNRQLADQRYQALLLKKADLAPNDYENALFKINNDTKRNTIKYVAEGLTFLLFILVGAFWVYRTVRQWLLIQQQEQNFMMAVTHELKTPIAVARLNLETLQKYKLDAEKHEKLIRNTLDETARLDFLTNNILIASQLEGGRYQAAKEELDLSDLLGDCMQKFRIRFPERKFEVIIEPEVTLKGDPLLLQILVNNLVENAIKYSPKNSTIRALLKKNKLDIELQVIDEGPGIPDDEKKKIFNRFYRIGNECTRNKQGTGLGLYLCRIIAHGHKADIVVTNNKPHGSNFTVIFKT